MISADIKQCLDKVDEEINKIYDLLMEKDHASFAKWRTFVAAFSLAKHSASDQLKMEKLLAADRHLLTAESELHRYGIEKEQFIALNAAIKSTINLINADLNPDEASMGFRIK